MVHRGEGLLLSLPAFVRLPREIPPERDNQRPSLCFLTVWSSPQWQQCRPPTGDPAPEDPAPSPTNPPAPLIPECNQDWKQCGGGDWAGPTCCQTYSSCTVRNEVCGVDFASSFAFDSRVTQQGTSLLVCVLFSPAFSPEYVSSMFEPIHNIRAEPPDQIEDRISLLGDVLCSCSSLDNCQPMGKSFDR